MKVKVQGLDEEIRTIVRGQADMGHDGRQALEEVNTPTHSSLTVCACASYCACFVTHLGPAISSFIERLSFGYVEMYWYNRQVTSKCVLYREV